MNFKELKRSIVLAVNRKLNSVSHYLDKQHDKRLVGISLGQYVPTQHREDLGATASQSSPYLPLQTMLGNEVFDENGVFADIGCGKGRALAYMAAEYGYKGRLRGIELNEEVAAIASSWAENYPNVEIICGNAFEQDFSDITTIFIARPFETEAFKKFIGKVESEIHHPLTFYYYIDQVNGGYLKKREGWTLVKRKKFYRRYLFLTIALSPQWFSKWTYIPPKEIQGE